MNSIFKDLSTWLDLRAYVNPEAESRLPTADCRQPGQALMEKTEVYYDEDERSCPANADPV